MFKGECGRYINSVIWQHSLVPSFLSLCLFCPSRYWLLRCWLYIEALWGGWSQGLEDLAQKTQMIKAKCNLLDDFGLKGHCCIHLLCFARTPIPLLQKRWRAGVSVGTYCWAELHGLVLNCMKCVVHTALCHFVRGGKLFYRKWMQVPKLNLIYICAGVCMYIPAG